MEALGTIANVAGLITTIATLAQKINDVRERYKYAALNITLVASSLWTIRAALKAIDEWRKTADSSSPSSKQLDHDLSISLESCALLVTVIDRKLNESHLIAPTVFDKIRFLSLDNIFKDFTSNLDAQVRALQLLLTIYQCRTLTEQNERLQRRETRHLIRRVRDNTASLPLENQDLEDAASILSDGPSVELAVDSVLMNTEIYKKVYKERYLKYYDKISTAPSLPTRGETSSKVIERKPLAITQKAAVHRCDDSFLGFDLGLPFLGIPYSGEIQPELPDELDEIVVPTLAICASNESLTEDDEATSHKNTTQQCSDWPKSDEKVLLSRSDRKEGAHHGSGEPSLASRESSSQSSDTREVPIVVTIAGEQETLTSTIEDIPLVDEQSTGTVEEALIELKSESKSKDYEIIIEVEHLRKPEKHLLGERQLESSLDENVVDIGTKDTEAKADDDPAERKTTKTQNFDEEAAALTTSHDSEQLITSRLEISSQLGTDISDLYAAIERSLDIDSQQDEKHVMESSPDGKSDINSPGSKRPLESLVSPPCRDGSKFDDIHDTFQPNNKLVKSGTHVPSLISTSEDGLGITLLATRSVSSLNESLDKVPFSDSQATDKDAVSTEERVKVTVIEPNGQGEIPDLKDGTEDTRSDLDLDVHLPRTVISAVMVEESDPRSGNPIDITSDGLHLTILENEPQVAPQYPPQSSRISPPEPREDSNSRRAQQTQDAISYISSLGVKIGNNAYLDRDGSTCSSADTSNDTHEKKTPNTAASSPPLRDLSAAANPPRSLKSPRFMDTSTIGTSKIGTSSSGSFQSPPFSEITSVTTSPPGSIQGQAHSEIQKLQILEEERNRRIASKPTKDAISKSMALIQQTYLSDASTQSRPSQKIHHLPSLSLLSLGSNNKASIGKAIGNAASSGNAQALLELLTNNPRLINLRTSNGDSDHPKTALMRAALFGHINCMEILSIRGADLSAVDRRGRTALHLAIAANQKASVKWLLRSSANNNAVKIRNGTLDLKEMPDTDGSRPLHIAARRNHRGLAERLVIAGANLESVDHLGRTPLHVAAMNGHLDTCVLLMEKFAYINAIDGDQMTPLHWASKIGHLDILDFLLLKGADRGILDSNGYLPLHHAVLSGHLEILERFHSQKQDLEVKTKSGEMPIHLACLNARVRIIEFLLQKGVQVNPWTTPPPARPGTRGLFSRSIRRENSSPSIPVVPSTPLHLACQVGHYEGSNCLLRNGAWVNAPQEEGKTPLMLAVESGNTLLVSLIIENGATINAKTSGLCETALHISCRRAELEIARILVQSGADVFARTAGSLPEKPVDYALKIPAKEISLDKRNAMIEYITQLSIQRSMASHVRSRMGPSNVGAAQTAAALTPWSQAPGGMQRLPQLPQTSPFNVQEFQQYFDPATALQTVVNCSPTPASQGASLPSKYRLA